MKKGIIFFIIIILFLVNISVVFAQETTTSQGMLWGDTQTVVKSSSCLGEPCVKLFNKEYSYDISQIIMSSFFIIVPFTIILFLINLYLLIRRRFKFKNITFIILALVIILYVIMTIFADSIFICCNT